MVDWGRKVGLLGYSMGGMATNLSAGNKTKVAELGIGAAVSIHPRSWKNIQPSQVPIFYTTGTLDVITPARWIVPEFLKVKNVPAVYAQLKWAQHSEMLPTSNQRWNTYSIAFYDCHLKGI